jgi:hypothetical protein
VIVLDTSIISTFALIGPHERARLQAMADTKRLLDQQLAH